MERMKKTVKKFKVVALGARIEPGIFKVQMWCADILRRDVWKAAALSQPEPQVSKLSYINIGSQCCENGSTNSSNS
jgi:hypothetical protein